MKIIRSAKCLNTAAVIQGKKADMRGLENCDEDRKTKAKYKSLNNYINKQA